MNNILNREIFLKRIVEIFFLYMILEGVLRKWIFPNFSFQIYFLKDIFLILIYLIALKYNLIFKLKFSKFFVFIIILISLYGLTGYDLDYNGIVSYVLGLRSYWLFLPLFLIVVHVYDKKDLVKFLKFNLYFIIPYFILTYLQSYLPETSFLNSGFDGMQMNKERPAGYFTYTTQNTYYFLFLFFCFCSYVLSKKEFLYGEIVFLVLLNFLLISIMILLKSRAVYSYVMVTVLFSSFYMIFSKQEIKLKSKKLILIFLVSFISFIASSKVFFAKEYKYSEVRINTDTYYQMAFVLENLDKKIIFTDISLYNFCSRHSSLCRIANELYFVSAIRKSSITGEGIGAGTVGVVAYNKTSSFPLGERENSRIVMELGFLVGSLFVVTKMIVTIILNIIALTKIRDEKNLIYIPILVFISVQILIGPLTYTTSFISFIFWFSLGLLFSSFKKTNIINR